MQINQSNLTGLFTGYKALFLGALNNTQTFWDKVAMRTTSTNLEEVYHWLGAFPRLKKFLGEVNIKNIAANRYAIPNDEYEATVSVKEAHVETDQYGIYNPMFEMAGFKGATHKDEIVFNLLTNGFTTLDYTGKNFFDTNKLHNPGDKKSGTFSNKGTKKLSAANFEAAVQSLKSIKDAEGAPLGIGLKLLLVVAPGNEHVARRILNAELINGGETNVNKGTAELLVSPYLSNADQWFVLEVGMPIKPLILQVVKDIRLTGMTDPTCDHVFKFHEFLYQAYGHYGAGYGLPQLAWGSTGADAA
jgi:phage major head subunit gpT-like protein